MRYRVLALFAIITACGSSNFIGKDKKIINLRNEKTHLSPKPKSCLNLVNGVETSEQEAVVLVQTKTGFCTGTFVSDSTLITAAHCLDKSLTGGLKYNHKDPLNLLHYGKLSGDKSEIWEDLAIVIFPKGTAKSYASLNSSSPQIGDRLMLIGFGQTDLINDNRPDGRKRKGYNTLKSIIENNTVINYESTIQPNAMLVPGEQAMTGRGDSGGPVFVNGGGLIGIVSRGTLDPDILREYDVNLFSASSLKLMEAAIAKGAIINGIDTLRRTINSSSSQLAGATPFTDSPRISGDATALQAEGCQ